MAVKLTCYNRGCGQKFDPSENGEDSCTHHPGVPFFHDAYKGWTCCNKKSVDFTEFLNIKGCTRGQHSNVKPPEPEKPANDANESEDAPAAPPAVKIPEPVRPSTLVRPAFESPLTTLEPTVNAAFKQQIDDLPEVTAPVVKKSTEPEETAPGTICKHGGCNYAFEGTKNDQKPCVYHPGVPIFHEGMKFWSCCQRKTSDFTAFMNQAGCESGQHRWTSDEEESKTIKCRLDWHQTATQVVVTVYAKMCHYRKSTVRLNPIRLAICLVFPQQHNQEYNVDLELRGIVDVAKSKVQMFGTKVEITLAKAEPGHWPKLDFPSEKKPKQVQKQQEEERKKTAAQQEDSDSDVDLDDVTPTFRQATITEVK